MNTLERLQALLARDFDLAPEALVPSATLEALDIDSLRLIEILFTMEDAFAIKVEAEPAEIRSRVNTLGELAAYVDELVDARKAAA